MSKKANKEREYLDPATNHVVADYTQNEPADFMNRIHQVNRLCPGQSKQNINYLLKTNDYDVAVTVRRIKEEGAEEMIGEWSKSTSKKSKKKKASGGQKEQIPAPASKPQNNLETRPASDSRTTKPQTSTTNKPTTAPPVSSQTAPRINSSQPPTDSINNSHLQPQPIHHFNSENLQFHQSVVSQRISPNLTAGGSSNIQFLLLQLQTQNSQLTQWQGMLEQRMDSSQQLLQFVFEQLQSSLNERYQLLYSNIESGKNEARKIFEQRRKLAQKLTAQAKKATTEQTADNIRRFLADKMCDQQLNDVYTLEIEHEALLSGLQSLGDIVNSIPVYSNWTPPVGTESVPSYVPPVQAQQIQQPVPSLNNYSQVPDTHVDTEEPVPSDEFIEQEPAHEETSMSSRVMEVTLKDPYSSEAKAVDLKSLASKTSKEELEAARMRMQQVLDKQGRSMIVSDTGSRPAVAGNRRVGERRGGKEVPVNKGNRGGKYQEKRGPPPRYQGDTDGRQHQWSGPQDNGVVWSTEFTATNHDELDEPSWDNQFVESLELVNNNYSDGENDFTDIVQTEFNSSQKEYSTEQPTLQSSTAYSLPDTKKPEAVSTEQPTLQSSTAYSLPDTKKPEAVSTEQEPSIDQPTFPLPSSGDSEPAPKPSQSADWSLDGDW